MDLNNLRDLYVPAHKLDEFITLLAYQWNMEDRYCDSSVSSATDKEFSEPLYDVLEEACNKQRAVKGYHNSEVVLVGFNRERAKYAHVKDKGYCLGKLVLAYEEDDTPWGYRAVPMDEGDLKEARARGLVKRDPNPAPPAVPWEGSTDQTNTTSNTPSSTTNESEGKSKMAQSIKATAAATVSTNKDAALLAAKVAVGKAGNKLVIQAVKPKLPMIARGYADTVFGSLIAANIAQVAVNQFMPDNRKAKVVADAMVQAAMLDVLGEIDIEGMMDGMLTKVKGAKVEKLLSAEDKDLGLD